MLEELHKMSIGGIKFSKELVQVVVSCGSISEAVIAKLLHLIAEKGINISFLCHSSVSSGIPETIFCVEQSDFGKVQEILNFTSFKSDRFDVVQSVGTLTVFPHRNSFTLVGDIVRLANEKCFPLHSFSSSISALAFNTDFHLLDHFADSLQTIVDLPDNHAPFRQQSQT